MKKKKKGRKPDASPQKNKQEGSKKNAWLITLIITLFAAWITTGYSIFTINLVDINKEREAHHNKIRVLLPFWEKLDKDCGNYVFYLDKDRVSEKQKHDFFMAHYMDILACADSMVNIATKMKPLLEVDEFKKVVENNVMIVVSKQVLVNTLPPFKDSAEDIANDIKLAYKKFLFSNGIEEKNVKQINTILYQIDQLAPLIFENNESTKKNIELYNECMKKSQEIADYYKSPSDLLPWYFEKMKEKNETKIIEYLEEEVYNEGIITPMIKNWKIIEKMIHPYFYNNFKIPCMDLYISYNFVWQIILSVLLYFICGRFIWHLIKRLDEKTTK